MILKFSIKKFIISLVIPLAVGGLSALITSGDMEIYKTVERPPLSPPSIVFPITWTILYILMGISLYLVWTCGDKFTDKSKAYFFFTVQLVLNFLWSPVFFTAQLYLLAFIILLLMWIFTILMIISFYKISKPAGLLQIPYLLWLIFAGYLNLSIYILNK